MCPFEVRREDLLPGEISVEKERTVEVFFNQVSNILIKFTLTLKRSNMIYTNLYVHVTQRRGSPSRHYIDETAKGRLFSPNREAWTQDGND